MDLPIQLQSINVGGKLLDFSQPKVMGILNINKDSFFEGSRFTGADELVAAAAGMAEVGAGIIDIGGVSSRPGAAEVSALEECDRVIPAIEAISKFLPDLVLSVDTWRATVAEQALDTGASIVNDIKGGDGDREMIPMVARRQVPYIIMHMRGDSATMQAHTDYQSLLPDIYRAMKKKVERCSRLGVKDLIIDVGFGFAKTLEQNYELLRNLEYFHYLERPLLVGLSRKSMIYKPLEIQANEALNGSTVLHTIALLKNVHIIRVHDVKEAREAVRLVQLYQ